MGKKYDDIASKFGELEMKIKEIDERQKKKEGDESSMAWPAIQPAGRGEFSSQPALHPAGRDQSSIQPAKQGPAEDIDNDKVYSVVRRPRKTLGFSPITDQDIMEVMET